MNRKLILLLIVLTTQIMACAVNPVTGERNFQLYGSEWEQEIGAQMYAPMKQSQGGEFILDPELSRYVQDVGQRVVARLLGVRNDAQPLTEGAVVVASNLLPAHFATLETEKVAAIVSEHGGSTSHGAIFARALEIPAVTGATGILDAAVKAVETVDRSLEKIADAVCERGGTLLVTADHGNCELMVDPISGGPHTAHTTNPVPLWWIAKDSEGRTLRDGSLADLAPTMLDLLKIPGPDEMTGHSLIG